MAARHARWYAEPADFLRHTDCPRFWPVLEVEIDNLRAAARWAIDQADGPLMVDLARRLWMTRRVGELLDAVARDAVDRLRAPPVRSAPNTFVFGPEPEPGEAGPRSWNSSRTVRHQPSLPELALGQCNLPFAVQQGPFVVASADTGRAVLRVVAVGPLS